MTEFETMALDHKKHHHCVACGGCIVDPQVQPLGIPVWCKGCMTRIDTAMPKEAVRPWAGGVIYR